MVAGAPAPPLLKVTACYEGSWLGEGEIVGPDALARAGDRGCIA
jgi:hypothetical protein